ncbi:MAG: tetratricopeptide repeat protein [candidate division WOR-3 bacterium]|nr:MAG: tetratricopeptide repeat protein [candidate division WOR-3 bacterium]
MTISLLLAIPAALVLCLAAGVIFFFVGRASAARQYQGREVRLVRLEKKGSMDQAARLRVMKRKVGVLYLDGLPFAGPGEVGRLYEAGLKHAAKGGWDRALKAWAEASAKAEGSEKAALEFLCGGCHLLRRRTDRAKRAFELALRLAARAEDKAGIASCRFALGEMTVSTEPALAEEHFTESVRLWQGLGDAADEARGLSRLAELARREGDTERALRFHRQALSACEESKDAVGAALQYAGMGDIMSAAGEQDKARAAYEDGLQLAREAKDRRAEVRMLSSIGRIHLVQAGFKRALDTFGRVLKLHRELGDQSGQAFALLQLAYAHQGLGQADVALEFFERALSQARKVGDRRLEAGCLAGIAVGRAAHGNYERATELLEQAVGLAREARADADLSSLLSSLGQVLLKRRKLGEAEHQMREALAIAEQGGDRTEVMRRKVELAGALRLQGQTEEALVMLEGSGVLQDSAPESELRARANHEAGLNHLAAGDAERAVAELTRAVAIRRKLKTELELGRTLVGLGLAEKSRRNLDAALRTMEDGLKLLNKAGTRADEAWALRRIGGVNELRGNPQAAKDNLLRALELSQEVGDGRGEGSSLVRLGRLCAAHGEVEEARGYLEQAARVYVRIGAEADARDVSQALRRLPRPGTGVRFVDDSE